MNIIFEDKNLAVIDKPAGVLVHPVIPTPPRCGTSFTSEVKLQKNTVVDYITKKFPEIKNYNWPVDPGLPAVALAKAGIVHRLDKDTSGLILIAKNPQTQKYLQDQFKNHQVQKTYLALVLGKAEPKEGIIKTQISRDQKNRTTQKTTYFNYSWQKMKSRFAETQYKVLQYLSSYTLHVTRYTTLLELHPKTGRMHQLRIHCQYIGHPIIGDQKYFTKKSKKISQILGLSRQFLHAAKLTFTLPNGTIKTVESKLPENLKIMLNKLSIDKG